MEQRPAASHPVRLPVVLIEEHGLHGHHLVALLLTHLHTGAGDEVFPGVYVGAIVAGVEEGGRGDAQVNLLSPRLPEQADNPAAGGSLTWPPRRAAR